MKTIAISILILCMVSGCHSSPTPENSAAINSSLFCRAFLRLCLVACHTKSHLLICPDFCGIHHICDLELKKCAPCSPAAPCSSGSCFGRICVGDSFKARRECGLKKKCVSCHKDEECASQKCMDGKCAKKKGRRC